MPSFETVRFRGSGLDLVADLAGQREAPLLLFLHGSGQTRQSWRKALAVAQSRGISAVAIDMRGHGDSDWAQDAAYGVDAFADDLEAIAESLPEPPIVVGASLGGLAGIIAASRAAALFRALVLVDITTRIERTGAQEVIDFMGSAEKGFASLEEAADAVARYLPHRPRPKETSGLARNLRRRDDGRYYWHWDPAFHEHGKRASKAARDPAELDAAARRLRIPTLLIRGRRSRILSDEGVRTFLELVPHAEYVDIADAHHMVAGDANDAFNAAVFDFAERLLGAPAQPSNP